MKNQIKILIAMSLFLNSCNSENSKSEYFSNEKATIIHTLRENNIIELGLNNNLLNDKIWIGIPTPYEIKNTNNKEYFIEEVDNESKRIVKKDKNQYSILVKKGGKHSITILNKAKETIIIKEIEAKYLPNLIPSFCGETGGKIGMKQLSSCIEKERGIVVTSVNYDIDIRYKVKEFELVIFDKRGKSIITKSESEYFNDRQIEHLLKVKTGDRFYLEKIIVERLDERDEEVRIMSFEIT